MKFEFDIEPVSQTRPRVSTKPYLHVYDPANVKRYKSTLARLARLEMNARGVKPLTGALEVEVIFYRQVQKSVSKSERYRRLSGAVRPIVKPDVDNYTKALLDGLNGIIWADDNSITDLTVRKRYAEKGRIEVEVREVGG